MAENKAKLEEKKKQANETDADSKDAADVSSSTFISPNFPQSVVVHPLVLLSVVDHYNRVAKGTRKRVVGILLGSVFKGKVDVTNSYAVPFEEDAKDPNVWFLDHTYHEEMFIMFKKVNAKERVVGWYSTGSKTKPADIAINELLKRYTSNPVYCIIDVNPQDDLEIPVKSFYSKRTEQAALRHAPSKTFERLPVEIGAVEAEEVGVEHLLRDIRDTTESTLADQVTAKLNSLTSLKNRMEEIHRYLCNVSAKKLPVNHEIIYNIQDIFNLVPNLKLDKMVKAFAVNTNDNLLVVYLASLIRSILALHDLIKNKVMNRDHEQKQRLREKGLLDEDGNEIKQKPKKASSDDANADEEAKEGSANASKPNNTETKGKGKNKDKTGNK